MNANNIDKFENRKQHISLLFETIKLGETEQFLNLLSKFKVGEIDINVGDANGNHFVFFAIVMNKPVILEKLIEYGTRLDYLDAEGYSILYHPIKYSYLEIIDVLLTSNDKIVGLSIINIKDVRGNIPLFYAIKYLMHNLITRLLRSGADANFRNKEGLNSLHLAVLKRDAVVVRILIPYIRDINAHTNSGQTALHFACSFQLKNIVQILLEAHADQNIYETQYMFYPVFYTVIQNNIELTQILIRAGLNPNNQDFTGNTILHYSVLENHDAILDFIMEYYSVAKLKINAFDENTNMAMPEKNKFQIDPNIVNINGLTVTHLLLYQYRDDVRKLKYIKKLLYDANLNYQDNTGNTLLHLIVVQGLLEEFRDILIKKKLNIYILNSANKTVFDLVPLRERQTFIEIVAESYQNYLQHNSKIWTEEWQNLCAKLNTSNPPPNITSQKCQELIKSTILDARISIPIHTNKKLISIITDPKVDFTTFTGSLLDVVVGFKYLTKKYHWTFSLITTNQEHYPELEKYYSSLGIRENPNQHLLFFEIKWIYQKLFFPPNFDACVKKNLASKDMRRFLILPISIIIDDENHANGFVYDFKTHTLERFEPHGSDYPVKFNYNPERLDNLMLNKIKNIMADYYQKNIEIIYYRPKNYLPKIGFQTLENAEISINKNIGDPNGFCALWTIWYLDYRLHYYDKKPSQLVKSLINQIRIKNLSFRNTIRDYSQSITKLRDSYLTKINRNINDYINNHLTPAEIKKLLEIVARD